MTHVDMTGAKGGNDLYQRRDSGDAAGAEEERRPPAVTAASGAAQPIGRHGAGTLGRLLRSGLAVVLVCAVLAPAARAFEVCPNAHGPDAYCPDGWACCLYPYGPGYWC